MNKDKLIEKWLKNELTLAEQKEFEQLEDFHLNREIIEGSKKFKASHFSKPSRYEEFKAQLNASSKPTKIIRLNTFMRIAAAVVISLGVYFAFFANSTTTIETLASQQNTVILPDESSVTLNAQSTIAFNKKSWNDMRQVNLKGEAFFKVAKGSSFDVITDAGTVTVLGTEFTVNHRDAFFEVKCFEGIVSVLSDGEVYKLTEGKTFRNISGQSTLGKVSRKSPEWLDAITNFESVPFDVVLRELERQYNVTISVENIDIDRIFTGGFVHTDLEQALIEITTPLKLNYRKESENKISLYSIKE